MSYLAQKGPTIEKFVTIALIKMVCRLTKLGWFDGTQHREITQEVTKFLQATVDHSVIGLQILNELVTEMNQPIPGHTLTVHRKTAVSFREVALFHIFQVALTTLRQVNMHVMNATPEQENKAGEQALDLAIKCLSFDFIGTNPDESSEDIGALQVPSSWRVVIQEPSTMQLLFDVYNAMPSPISARSLECLMLLASVRRSLFTPDSERTKFLGNLIKGIRTILQTQAGLADQQNYHEFCRFLGRLKSNYQLSELVKTDGYKDWMELATDFTVKSLHQWQWSSNSVNYLLSFWARLVAAVPYVRIDPSGKNSPELETYVPQVVRAYIQSRVDSVQQCAGNDTIDRLLDDEGSVLEQLEKLMTICHFQFRNMGDFLLSLFDPLLQQYTDLCDLLNGGMSGGNQSLEVVEEQLAWIVYIVGAIIGGHSYNAPTHDSSAGGDELVDADLSQRVFRLMQLTEHRLIASGGRSKCDLHLEMALLYYFHSFRRTYIGEQHGMPSTSSPPVNEKHLSQKHKTYLRMFEHLGLGSHTVVVNMIITKIGNNLKFWGDDSDVIGKTLSLFMDIASGYSSGKLLLGLDTVQYLLEHHTAEEFPFLAVPANTRHRTTFHAILSKLLFTSYDDMSGRHEKFMAPLVNVLSQLMQTPNFRQPDVKQAIIGVCRDLRGITSATHNRKTYGSLFEVLYPAYFPVIVRAAEEWYDDPSVTTAVLKFMQEFSYNKAQRVMFDQSSANGILLFREISKVVVAYGSRIFPRQVGNHPYNEKYKGISICLDTLARAFGGNYVNFGVFGLYNDKALENALETALQLALSIPLSELMSFPKVKKSYFAFVEILFRNHMVSVVSLDTAVFFQLVSSLHEGLSYYDLAIAAQCASAVDHLATFYYEQEKKKDSAPKMALAIHLQTQPTIFTTLLTSLFNILVYGEATSQWALSRPILSITLCSEDALNAYKQHIGSTQSVENQARVMETFSKLFAEIQPNLEPANRDKFTQKLGQFRTSIRGFLTL